MKQNILKGLLLVLVLMSCSKPAAKSLVDKEMANSSLYADLEGHPVSIEDYKGQKVILNFWATWCVPCLEEMPSLLNAQNTLPEDKFVFLFATTDPLDKILRFKKKHAYPFKYLQYKGTLDKLKIHALPVTFIYDSEGNLVERIDGLTHWDSEEMLNRLRSI